jgi:hypothetical protein
MIIAFYNPTEQRFEVASVDCYDHTTAYCRDGEQIEVQEPREFATEAEARRTVSEWNAGLFQAKCMGRVMDIMLGTIGGLVPTGRIN